MIDSATLTQFARLFVSRRDDYALQRETGRYVRVGAPVSAAALSRHLSGIQTMGTYVIDEGGLCRFAVYDADTPDGLSMLAEVQARLAADGVPSARISRIEMRRNTGRDGWPHWKGCPLGAFRYARISLTTFPRTSVSR